jgi:thiol-disulfide isomerase/thioredoxin
MDFVETMKLTHHTQIILLFTAVFSSSVFSGADALIGQITRSDLDNSAHKIWFNQNYESHVVDIEATKKARAFLADVSITIFMGTWCHDSQREVPALLKVLDQIPFNQDQLNIIGLSMNKDTPMKLEQDFDIRRTPTFIFSRSGKEIGRYVERPRISLEQDLLKIVSGSGYQNAYAE